jgi:glycosyltransferase involved in cell wall biosynthesis
VLTQSYPESEYLMMDGGSTDETVMVLRDYAGRFTWVSERDRGQADAVSKGWRRARGSIVAYLIICQPTVFLRRELVERLASLDESLHYSLDYDLWIRVGRVGPFPFIPHSLAHSRLRGDVALFASLARECGACVVRPGFAHSEDALPDFWHLCPERVAEYTRAVATGWLQTCSTKR